MKTPEEIKKLLANHKNYIFSAEELFADALTYIRELETQLVNQATEYSQALKITTEQRDAAADDIELGVCCETCKHDNDDDEGAFCVGCVRITSRGNWEWRGVKNNAE